VAQVNAEVVEGRSICPLQGQTPSERKVLHSPPPPTPPPPNPVRLLNHTPAAEEDSIGIGIGRMPVFS